MKRYASILLFLFSITSCSMLVLDGAALAEGNSHILIVVDDGLDDSLAQELEQYREDLDILGLIHQTISFSGSAADLRTELTAYNDGTWTAFLIGNIPWVFYEQEMDGNYEQFPIDLYYSAPKTDWEDADGNNILDGHSPIAVSLPVSRIIGTTDELKSYFHKNHAYRSGTLTFQDKALIFKDDDWSSYLPGNDFGIDNFVKSVSIIESPSETNKTTYIGEVSADYRYVYQWIHAVPFSLYIQEVNNYNVFSVLDINSGKAGSGFYNLFNCKGSRFSENNLGMSYIIGTESGLAVLGSTKVGGNFEPLEFHRSLSAGLSWGNAYRNWYNQTGKFDDSWYLGMVILGDPALRIKTETIDSRGLQGGASLSNLIPPSEEEKQSVLLNLQQFDQLQTGPAPLE